MVDEDKRVEGQLDPIVVAWRVLRLQTFAHVGGVAVLAARRNLGTPGGRVPGVLGPLSTRAR